LRNMICTTFSISHFSYQINSIQWKELFPIQMNLNLHLKVSDINDWQWSKQSFSNFSTNVKTMISLKEFIIKHFNQSIRSSIMDFIIIHLMIFTVHKLTGEQIHIIRENSKIYLLKMFLLTNFHQLWFNEWITY
jgi:hypothetical protein